MQRNPQGELCGCGRRGCWETQVGPRAVLSRVK
jgi:predicted NBD/HSP70 family sugar kinase